MDGRNSADFAARVQPLPYECHEGNGAIKYIMSAERAEDRALEEDGRRDRQAPSHAEQHR